MSDQTVAPTQEITQASPEEDQNSRPIVLNLTLGKVNYILSMLAQLPYEKSYQPIQDLQQMVIAQLQAPANDSAADGSATLQ